MIDIFIDKLTESIKNRTTGEVFETVISLAESSILKETTSWKFDWAAESKKKYSLQNDDP